MRTVIDLVLLAIIIISIWSGYKKGFIMGIAGVVAIVVSLYAASLVSSAFSYEVVPALRPFASGYVESQMQDTVLEDMGLADTELSYEDILSNDPELRHDFCATCYKTFGIYDDAAEMCIRDRNMSASNLAFFARQFLLCKSEDINFHTLPGNYGDSIKGLSYVSINISEWLEMVNTYLNPYDQDVTEANVNILTHSSSTGFYSTTGYVAGGVDSFYDNTAAFSSADGTDSAE